MLVTVEPALAFSVICEVDCRERMVVTRAQGNEVVHGEGDCAPAKFTTIALPTSPEAKAAPVQVRIAVPEVMEQVAAVKVPAREVLSVVDGPSVTTFPAAP